MRLPFPAACLAATLLPPVLARAEPAAGAPDAAPYCSLSFASRTRADGTTCRGCHEFKATPTGRIMRRHAAGDHDGGVVYADALQRRALHLRAQADLPSEIVLVEGRIGCTTCHDGASKERRHIATRGGLAGLCVSCHDL